MIRSITDIHAPALITLMAENENRLRRHDEPAPGLFVCETVKVIRRALDAGHLAEAVLIRDDLVRDEEVEELIEYAGEDVPVYLGTEELLREISGSKLPGGVLCLMRRRALPAAADLCRGAKRVVWLEDVENPTNVGAIFRSAAAIGMDAVVLTKACADPLYRRAARVSMGNVFQVPWTFTAMTGPADRLDPQGRTTLAALKEQGFVIVALALEEGALPIDAPELRAAAERAAGLVIVLGNESNGISPETIAACDYTAVIPMMNGVDSLNVAAASAVAFWELRAGRA